MANFKVVFTFNKSKIVNHCFLLKTLAKQIKESDKRVVSKVVKFKILAFTRCVVGVRTATTFPNGATNRQQPQKLR